jgi:hypothetical protein
MRARFCRTAVVVGVMATSVPQAPMFMLPAESMTNEALPATSGAAAIPSRKNPPAESCMRNPELKAASRLVRAAPVMGAMAAKVPVPGIDEPA